MPDLDIEFIRSQFPAFSQPDLQDLAFFENAGGSYTCRQVIDRLTRFYHERKMQPYGPAAPTKAGGEEMDEARERLAALLNVESDELSFGPSTTQNTYVLAQAFRQMLSAGDAIIVTDQDHEANSGPWRRLAADGIDVRVWPVNRDTGALDRGDLLRLLDKKVQLVCFPHCSNIVGQVNPVANWVEDVHSAGAVACVDGVSFAPHGLPDVGGLGADIYLFSSYKTYGPHQGIMVLRRELADRLPNQAHFFNGDVRYKRFTPAGPDHAQVAACAGMADYVDAVHAHHFGADAEPAERARRVLGLQASAEAVRLAPLLSYLRGRNDIRLLGPASGEGKVPTVAFRHASRGDVLAEALASEGIIAGGGDFYATRVLEAMGEDPEHGVLRLSFVHYTDAAEVERLLTALDKVLGQRG
ncbi:aminotransferase class V-fold PLP-dependent enzyme [Algicella marina]|uniref:Aminotransferase class V-fold PLP-dependent enzyme n=1 Tax=Algicella marina TaxID=2683284 RepID=A0A6P1SYA9_9RHOB|nr:aminotransferase class V-fold PLP-dependent enzyme [Algicella marina]QHQ35458.1 aminotransferase class V-fold PLP-dependent enzyme [Algicella marina]